MCFPAGISAFAIQPTPAVVTEGSVARFSCKISAHPPSIITWEFNRVTLPLTTERCGLYWSKFNFIVWISADLWHSIWSLIVSYCIYKSCIIFLSSRITVLPSGVLQIHRVQRADAGNYRCISTNIASRRRSTEATLTVFPGVSVKYINPIV